MSRDYFIFKSQIGFGIKSDEFLPDIITNELGIIPDSFMKKGDSFTSKFSPRIGRREWNLWKIYSAWTESEKETVSHHIEYFKDILLPKADLIKKYKENDRLELSFWISIETDNAGAGFYLLDDELAFLNEFSNWIHISVIVKEFDDTPR